MRARPPGRQRPPRRPDPGMATTPRFALASDGARIAWTSRGRGEPARAAHGRDRLRGVRVAEARARARPEQARPPLELPRAREQRRAARPRLGDDRRVRGRPPRGARRRGRGAGRPRGALDGRAGGARGPPQGARAGRRAAPRVRRAGPAPRHVPRLADPQDRVPARAPVLRPVAGGGCQRLSRGRRQRGRDGVRARLRGEPRPREARGPAALLRRPLPRGLGRVRPAPRVGRGPRRRGPPPGDRGADPDRGGRARRLHPDAPVRADARGDPRERAARAPGRHARGPDRAPRPAGGPDPRLPRPARPGAPPAAPRRADSLAEAREGRPRRAAGARRPR